MTPAYIIVDMKVSNPEQYKEYMAAAPAAVKAHGGEYLVRGGKFETIEGNWTPARVAMLRFPSFDAAKAFYDAEMYRAARAKRERLSLRSWPRMLIATSRTTCSSIGGLFANTWAWCLRCPRCWWRWRCCATQ